MRRQPLNVEWHIAEDDADWERLRAQSTSAIVSPRATGRNVLRYMPLLLLIALLAGAGGWAWQRIGDHSAPAPVNGPEQIAVASPPSASDNGELQPVVPTPLATPAERALPLQRSDAFSSQEVVRMLSHPDQALQTGQETSQGPLRTALDVALWGPPRRLETTSFVIHFRHRDVRVVTRAAPKIEALYGTMLNNFGVNPARQAGKLVIVVSELHLPATALDHWPDDSHFVVRSPSLYGESSQLSQEVILLQGIVLELIDYTLVQAARNPSIYSSRQHVLDGLRLWQLWHTDLPLAAWREEIVRWVYVTAPASHPAQASILPNHYAELCAAHRLWLPYPAAIQIPLVCTDLDQLYWHPDARFVHSPPLQLPPLWAPVYLDEEADWKGRTRAERHPGQAIALATVVEYAVATYGREQLPAFVAGLGQHETWETFLPAVFGVSVAEFERGWQTYLSMHYL